MIHKIIVSITKDKKKLQTWKCLKVCDVCDKLFKYKIM